MYGVIYGVWVGAASVVEEDKEVEYGSESRDSKGSASESSETEGGVADSVEEDEDDDDDDDDDDAEAAAAASEEDSSSALSSCICTASMRDFV